ncbi:innexin Vnx-d5.1 [Ichnoviriform fugitivi]|uniref:Innexin Vnx-d5.1 n=1 Tax=Ichnoviriform fugitivi TaxID=265522 RepID=Q6Q2K9_9VIRU|nr:innexin Vnx-d5.1 [Ichnoviriform fugitivi]AAS79821.1 innexin Vnx-d5.1 [Ichnoviriform fugitivi]
MGTNKRILVYFKLFAMVDTSSFLRGLLKVQSIATDENFNRLHYKITATILLFFSLLISWAHFSGDAVDCDFPGRSHRSLDTYCYAHSTFLVERFITGTEREYVPHPGVAAHVKDDKLKFYGYYGWVYIVLFLQALSFYIPHYMWKSWEGGKLKMLTVELTSPVLRKDCIKENTEPLIDYFCSTLHSHNSYAYKYFFCEMLNFINAVGQICFMNVFIGEDFVYYGIDIIMFNREQIVGMTDPMERLFPVMTKCTYQTFGPSGTLENLEGMCTLTQNALNARIYAFLWFWFYILAIISAFVVICRVVILISRSIRLYVFQTSSSLNSGGDIDVVFHKLRIGDWFLLHMLQQNINPLAYKQLICGIAQHCDDSGVLDA